jgi:DNA mismatch endonuclease (patch repair protein)
MPETLTKKQRSRVMAAVKSRNTKPEIIVRRLVHRLGFRFRLHRRDLPGTPDIVLSRLRKIINVHGCFWHLHTCHHARRAPVNNGEYWKLKRERNAARDKEVIRQLRKAGWKTLVIWECDFLCRATLTTRIRKFLLANH